MRDDCARDLAKMDGLLDWALDALGRAADALVAADFGQTATGVRTIAERITRERPRASTADGGPCENDRHPG